jgi:serine/threonine-protein kinase RsbW
VAVSEACTNVIEHASATDEYEVRLEIDDDQCEISVIDAGHGLDAAELNRSMPSPSDERGRGLALMRALVDRIELTSGPAAGTVVHLVKQLTPA